MTHSSSWYAPDKKPADGSSCQLSPLLLLYPYVEPLEGGFSGFLCAAFEAYRYGNPSLRFCPDSGEFPTRNSAPLIFEEVQRVPYSPDRAKRVTEGIIKRIGFQGFNTLYHAFLSDYSEREERIFSLIKKIMSINDPGILYRLDVEEAVYIVKAAKRTEMQAHRYMGILRFSYLKPVYYAALEPDCRVLPLLAPHFSNRFRDQGWIIHDTSRKEALIWTGKDLRFIQDLTLEGGLTEKDPYEDLWKRYFLVSPVKERSNPALQRNYLPRKYRSNLTEFK